MKLLYQGVDLRDEIHKATKVMISALILKIHLFVNL